MRHHVSAVVAQRPVQYGERPGRMPVGEVDAGEQDMGLLDHVNRLARGEDRSRPVAIAAGRREPTEPDLGLADAQIRVSDPLPGALGEADRARPSQRHEGAAEMSHGPQDLPLQVGVDREIGCRSARGIPADDPADEAESLIEVSHAPQCGGQQRGRIHLRLDELGRAALQVRLGELAGGEVGAVPLLIHGALDDLQADVAA